MNPDPRTEHTVPVTLKVMAHDIDCVKLAVPHMLPKVGDERWMVTITSAEMGTPTDKLAKVHALLKKWETEDQIEYALGDFPDPAERTDELREALS